jgi:hypothetical protein
MKKRLLKIAILIAMPLGAALFCEACTRLGELRHNSIERTVTR